MGLDIHRLKVPLDVAQIQHNTKATAWSGRGFTPARELKRFSISGRPVPDFFEELAQQTLAETSSFEPV